MAGKRAGAGFHHAACAARQLGESALAVLGAAAIAAVLYLASQLGGPLLAGLLVFPALELAAAFSTAGPRSARHRIV